MARRDLNDLLAELRSRGVVEAAARPPVTDIVQRVFLLLWPIPVIGGVVMLVDFRGQPTLPATGAAMIAAGAVLLGVALVLRRRALRTPWHTWRLDREGLSIAGTGPLPWSHVGPPERRMVPAAYSDGQELAWVLPLTGEGIAWTDGLDDDARRLFQPGFRRTLLDLPAALGAPVVDHVRLVAMQGVDADDWRTVLEEARQRFGRR